METGSNQRKYDALELCEDATYVEVPGRAQYNINYEVRIFRYISILDRQSLTSI